MSKIDIFQDRYEYHVSWTDEEADDEGAWIGQDANTPLDTLRAKMATAKQKREFDDYEYLAVEIAAQNWVSGSPAGVSQAGHGYEFETLAKAKQFLAAMRAEMKAAKAEYDSGVLWPEWAKQAQAAGWKPPKGWKP